MMGMGERIHTDIRNRRNMVKRATKVVRPAARDGYEWTMSALGWLQTPISHSSLYSETSPILDALMDELVPHAESIRGIVGYQTLALSYEELEAWVADIDDTPVMGVRIADYAPNVREVLRKGFAMEVY